MKISHAIAASALGMLLCAPAAASEYSALMRAHKYADVERLANARLAQDAGNADALVALSEVGLAEGRIEDAVKLGERCLAAQPKVANCHLAYGNALGTKAVSAGMVSAMSYAGKIRDAFKTAVELEPQNMDARFSLMTYYMQAPAIVGGGSGKAQTLAAQTALINAEAGKLMTARLDAADDKLAKAEAAVLAMPVSSNEAVAEGQRDLINNLGNKYLGDKKYADSERMFREAQKRFPDSEGALYGLARVQQELGKHREALAGFEQANAMTRRASTWYRIGKSQQALGDKLNAVASYGKALAFKPALPPKLRADADEQLKLVRQQ
ncbi:MAG: tetratricopeptide repeat protein [Pseudomonadota bacterium]